MKTNRKKQVMILSILLVAIIGLTIGFSMFTSNLSVKSSLLVNPNGTFSVLFSSSNNISDFSMAGVPHENIKAQVSSNTILSTDAIIDNSGPTIYNLGGTMTEAGQTITYNFYAVNISNYNAYLKDVTYNPAENSSSFRECSYEDGTTDEELNNICSGINVHVNVNGENFSSTQMNISNHLLGSHLIEPITVTISYDSSINPSKPFIVSFGDITLTYEDNSNGGDIDPGSDGNPDDFEYDFLFNIREEDKQNVVVNYDNCSFIAALSEEDGGLGMSSEEAAGFCSLSPSEIVSMLFEVGAFNSEEDSELDAYNALLMFGVLSGPSPHAVNITGYNGSDTDLVLPNTIEGLPVLMIENFALQNKNLTSVRLSENILLLGTNAFSDNNITTLYLNANINKDTINSDAFESNSIETIYVDREYDRNLEQFLLNMSGWKSGYNVSSNIVWNKTTCRAEGPLSLGTEVRCLGQKFYYLSSNNGYATLAAMYNLNVGNNQYPDTYTSNYGIQEQSINSGNYATVAFNSSNVSVDGSKNIILSGTNIYDNYLVPYLSYLNLEDATIRLINMTEAMQFSCANPSLTCGAGTPPPLYDTNYWIGVDALGTGGSQALAFTQGSATLSSVDVTNSTTYGVRPVIEVALDTIEIESN